MTDHDLAIAHRRYPCRGGAERVAETLTRTFDTELVTAYADVEPPADVDVTVRREDPWVLKAAAHTGALGNLIKAWFGRESFEHVPELHEADVVIESVVDAPWYVPPDSQTLIRYVHSPHRLAYDLYPEFAESYPKRWFARRMREAIEPTTSWADVTVCNSELVARRVRRYWGVDERYIRVVHPPVPVNQYAATDGDGPFVALSRLTGNKRMDVIIEAFRDLNADLLVVGDGPERESLVEQAQEITNLTLLGHVPEAQKVDLLEEARAVVYAAQNEDFGMVPIEAFAAGTPVIGPDEGFSQFQITAGETGWLWTPIGDESDMAANLRAAVERFQRRGVDHSPAELRAIAEQFGVERFREEMRIVVAEAQERAAITPSFDQTMPERDHEPIPATVADGGGDA